MRVDFGGGPAQAFAFSRRPFASSDFSDRTDTTNTAHFGLEVITGVGWAKNRWLAMASDMAFVCRSGSKLVFR